MKNDGRNQITVKRDGLSWRWFASFKGQTCVGYQVTRKLAQERAKEWLREEKSRAK